MLTLVRYPAVAWSPQPYAVFQLALVGMLTLVRYPAVAWSPQPYAVFQLALVVLTVVYVSDQLALNGNNSCSCDIQSALCDVIVVHAASARFQLALFDTTVVASGSLGVRNISCNVLPPDNMLPLAPGFNVMLPSANIFLPDTTLVTTSPLSVPLAARKLVATTLAADRLPVESTSGR